MSVTLKAMIDKGEHLRRSVQDTIKLRHVSAARWAGLVTIIMAATHWRQGTRRVLRLAWGRSMAVCRDILVALAEVGSIVNF